MEARAPVKNKVKNKKPITLFIVNNKPFYIFPPKKICCALSVQLTSFILGKGCLYLDYERNHFVIMFLTSP